ncbi:uncharacterized protein LOC132168466 [Corylus avellana]|uniref:uncharacterized protein LOC132168466 n=1 Tax=Corylus avellana TaxID=13451 RepID=UPI00286C53AE|nr:uncharacterized protein LOC132168466 [Corylus avellana]
MKKLEQGGHSSKPSIPKSPRLEKPRRNINQHPDIAHDQKSERPNPQKEKPRRNNNQHPDIAYDQKSERPATGGQTNSSNLKRGNSISKSGSSDGKGFSRLKRPIRVCIFACIIIWLVNSYVKSPLETRYAQMQCQIETLTSTINHLQQGIHPTDHEEYQTWMNYEGFAM